MTGKQHRSDKQIIQDEAEFAGKKKVTQSNHDVYTIPSCMAEWADEPLYLVVARWGLYQQKWINRNEIAEVFHMQGRRASFQLSYISRKKERVVCRTRHVPAEGGGRQRVEIFIDDILPAPEEGTTHALPRRRSVPAKQTGPASRGVGNGMAGNIGLWEQLLKGCREGRDE
ncbi:CaiF/GrlA family transcriptional regulator [Salmonella enterica subsp. enterica serovar Newport]|nr:CaiF/GrlA family transcriptional regulator [Salmonella enterica subsp. enterica serovar Newport]